MKYLVTEEELKKLDKGFTEEKYEKCIIGIIKRDLDVFLEKDKVKLTKKEKEMFYKIAIEYGNDYTEEGRIAEVMASVVSRFLYKSTHTSKGIKILKKYYWG